MAKSKSSKSKKNANVEAVAADVKRGPGRPRVYTVEQEAEIVRLTTEYNACGCQRILKARNGTVGVSKAEQANAKLRNAKLFPKPVSIGLPTIFKYAKAAGVSHPVGRPSQAEAA